MKITKKEIKNIIHEEIDRFNNNRKLLKEYTLDSDDIHTIRDLIRDEVATIMRVLWKKKNIWS